MGTQVLKSYQTRTETPGAQAATPPPPGLGTQGFCRLRVVGYLGTLHDNFSSQCPFARDTSLRSGTLSIPTPTPQQGRLGSSMWAARTMASTARSATHGALTFELVARCSVSHDC